MLRFLGFKPVAAELPGAESSEQVIAVFEQLKKRPVHTGHSMVCGSQCFPFCLQRDSALGASVMMTSPIPEVAHHTGIGGPGARRTRFKPVAAELPGTESSEQVIAVFERDSALGASGSMEDPVEEFIYESDEDAPRPSKIPTSPLPAPAEKVEKNTEEAEIKPSELKDEAAEEPELTCCGLCTYAGNP
ncbi:uncharacterized protein LOC105739319 isoform X1 [Nomascus leucogenys]|uniref:uncharacterized protein LOC105739319 isoform X1 n=1 Tax=Nomascus leucogenys TaxID=61853 RepID=UPI00122D9CAD|nr:uncharacterized protein LOC105739319 isoform X1 [Nomascus leucogenys]